MVDATSIFDELDKEFYFETDVCALPENAKCKKYFTTVCLVPSRTDTKWFHDFAMKGEIRFVKGPLKFGGCENSAPFPSAVVVFKGVERE